MREVRLLISSALVPAESASCSSWTLEQTMVAGSSTSYALRAWPGVIAAGDASRGLGSSTCVFHCFEFLGRLALVAGATRRPARPRRCRCGSPAGRLPSPWSRAPTARWRRRGKSAMSAPRRSMIRPKPARSRSQRFWRAATRVLRLLISSAIVPAEMVSCSSRTPLLLASLLAAKGFVPGPDESLAEMIARAFGISPRELRAEFQRRAGGA